mgnify:CR=1 FL=1
MIANLRLEWQCLELRRAFGGCEPGAFVLLGHDGSDRLRVVANCAVGVDNVDVKAATARGIVVMNAPGANSVSVAELAMGLILSMARHLPAADAAMKQGKWEKKKFLGEEVRDKVLGLAGLGRIGQEVARRAAAFGMRIVAHDPFISELVANDLGVELVSLDELFARADYVSLHMPSTAATKNIVNAERLARSRKGIRIVNTARGDLIDEKALADAIEAGQVGGAALDVFEKEPTVDHRLQMLPQVVATPHIAASTREGQELVGMETMAALRDFLRDKISKIELPREVEIRDSLPKTLIGKLSKKDLIEEENKKLA